MTKQLSFVVDDETIELLESLKRDLKAGTTAAVLRKALALTEIAVEQAKNEHGVMRDKFATVTIRAKDDPPGQRELTVALRA